MLMQMLNFKTVKKKLHMLLEFTAYVVLSCIDGCGPMEKSHNLN